MTQKQSITLSPKTLLLSLGLSAALHDEFIHISVLTQTTITTSWPVCLFWQQATKYWKIASLSEIRMISHNIVEIKLLQIVLEQHLNFYSSLVCSMRAMPHGKLLTQ